MSVPEVPASDYSGLQGDVCTVSQGSSEAVPPPTAQPSTTYLDAGEEITATAGGTTYAILTKLAEVGVGIYSAENTGSLPPLPETSFDVTVPGATFPAFAADAPGAGAVLALTGPTDLTTIGPASTFGWTPGPVAGAQTFVSLYVTQVLAENRTASVSCLLEDDGAFSFAAATQADMQAAGLSAGTLVLGERSSVRTYTEGDAALVLTVSRATAYASPTPPPTVPQHLYQEQLQQLLSR